jgi:tRNA G26 N,N-dimethylase Trm1
MIIQPLLANAYLVAVPAWAGRQGMIAVIKRRIRELLAQLQLEERAPPLFYDQRQIAALRQSIHELRGFTTALEAHGRQERQG